MRDLELFYRRWLKVLVGVIVTIAISYRFGVEPWLLAHVTMFEGLTKSGSSLIAGALFLGGEWFIRTRWWRLIASDLDFSGDWTGWSHYEEMPIAHPDKKVDLPFGKDHTVRIQQDCFRIAIVPTGGGFDSWNSIVMTYRPDTEELQYAYEVDYPKSEEKRFPADAIGFEKMKIHGRQKLRFGRQRPAVLKGKFYHCAMGQAPVYSGTVRFVRVGFEPRMLEEGAEVLAEIQILEKEAGL